MLLYDTNNELIITLEQLKTEYINLKRSQEVEDNSFDEFLENCLTRHNGTLDIITSDIVNFIAGTTYGTDNSPIDRDTAQYNLDCWREEGLAIPKQLYASMYAALYNYLIKK